MSRWLHSADGRASSSLLRGQRPCASHGLGAGGDCRTSQQTCSWKRWATREPICAFSAECDMKKARRDLRGQTLRQGAALSAAEEWGVAPHHCLQTSGSTWRCALRPSLAKTWTSRSAGSARIVASAASPGAPACRRGGSAWRLRAPRARPAPLCSAFLRRRMLRRRSASDGSARARRAGQRQAAHRRHMGASVGVAGEPLSMLSNPIFAGHPRRGRGHTRQSLQARNRHLESPEDVGREACPPGQSSHTHVSTRPLACSLMERVHPSARHIGLWGASLELVSAKRWPGRLPRRTQPSATRRLA